MLSHTIISVLLIIREVLLNNVVSLHVDLFIGVVLAVVDLFHTTALLNEESISVDRVAGLASGLLVKITDLEDVLESVQGNLDDLVIWAAEEVAEGLNAALGNQVADLLGLLETTAGGIANSPASFFTGLEVTILQKVDQRRNNVGIDHSLNLRRVASGNVGDGPASLFANTILGRAEQRQKAWQSTTVDDDLGLDVVTSDDVTNGSQSRGLDRCGSVHKEFHQSAGDASLDDSLDLVVGTVREVRDSPAGINQNLIIKRVDKLGQNRKSGGNLTRVSVGSLMQFMLTYSSPVRLRGLATAEVAQGPCGISKHAKLAAVSEKVKKRLEGATAEDVVTAVRAVASDVTKGPDSLFPNIGFRAGKELDKDRDSAGLNDDLSLGGGPRGDVGQGPSSLELNQSMGGSQKLDKAGNDTGLDDLLDRGVTLLGKKLSELCSSLNLRIDLVRENALHHLRKVLIQLKQELAKIHKKRIRKAVLFATNVSTGVGHDSHYNNDPMTDFAQSTKPDVGL